MLLSEKNSGLFGAHNTMPGIRSQYYSAMSFLPSRTLRLLQATLELVTLPHKLFLHIRRGMLLLGGAQ